MNTTTKVLLVAGLGAAGYYIWKSQNSGGSSSNSGGLDIEEGAPEKVVVCNTQQGTDLLMRGHYPSQDRGAYSLLSGERLRRETAFLDTIPEATSCSRVDVTIVPPPLNFAKCVTTYNSFVGEFSPENGVVFIYKAPTGERTDISYETIPTPTARLKEARVPRLIKQFEVVGIDGITVYNKTLWLRLSHSHYWVEATNFILVGNTASNNQPKVKYTQQSGSSGTYRLLLNSNIHRAPFLNSPAVRFNGNPFVLVGYQHVPEDTDNEKGVSLVHINRVVYGGYCPLPNSKLPVFLNDRGEKRLTSCEWGEIEIDDPDNLQESSVGYIPLNITYLNMSDNV